MASMYYLPVYWMIFFCFFFFFFFSLMGHGYSSSSMEILQNTKEGVKGGGCMSCPYLVVFGASMSDVGENAAAMPFRSAAEFPPYGIDYFGKPANRFSNGRLFLDFLSQELGYGLLHPYLKSVGADFTHGVSFASSGSTFRNSTVAGNGSSNGGLFSFLIQVDQFRQFKDAVISATFHPQEGSGLNLPRVDTLEEAVVLIEFGLNDYTEGKEEDMDLALAMLELGMRSVLAMGMKKFVVVNLYPMGCMPSVNSFPDFVRTERDSYGCVPKLNQISDLHNARVAELVLEKLASEYPSATFLVFDVNSLFMHAIHNPSLYGLSYYLEACCGYFNKGEMIRCGESGYVEEGEVYYVSKRCDDPSLYLTWDGIHPTETFAYYMANGILNGSFLLPSSFIVQKTCTTSRRS